VLIPGSRRNVSSQLGEAPEIAGLL